MPPPTDFLVLPPWVVIAVAAVGLTLALIRPYLAFLLAVCLPVAASMRTTTFTRIDVPGAYVNLQDAALAIGLAAVLLDSLRQRYMIRVRAVAAAMITVLLIGAALTTFQYGLSYFTVRALRWGLTVPLYFVIGDNILRSDRRRVVFFRTLLVATVVAAVQQIVYYFGRVGGGGVAESLAARTTAFQMAHCEIWLLAGPLLVGGHIRRVWLQLPIALLFLGAVLTVQSRNTIVAFVGALPVLHLWLLRRRALTRQIRLLMIGVFLLLVTTVAIVFLGAGDLITSYTGRIVETASDWDTAVQRETRVEAALTELKDFMESSLVFGRGLDYFTHAHDLAIESDAGLPGFGHVGYVTYLSQLGIVGFVVYAIWFPCFVLRRARAAYNTFACPSPIDHMAALTAAMFLYGVLQFFITNHYLAQDVLSGVLAGFVASLYHEKHRGLIPQPRPVRLTTLSPAHVSTPRRN